MAKFLKIKNFETYQHYKHRNPPWIKLHLSLLDDPDFLSLSDASKWHYIGLILLASRHENAIKPDINYISKRLGLTENLDLSKRFLKDHVLAPRKHHASVLHTNADSEKSRDRVETETETEEPCVIEFEVFWDAYPKKVGKKAARKAWDNAKDRPELKAILFAVDAARDSDQWRKDSGQFIPHPATWLNHGRWADLVMPKQPSLMEEFLARGKSHDGSRTVLQGLVDAHHATVGEAVPGPKRAD